MVDSNNCIRVTYYTDMVTTLFFFLFSTLTYNQIDLKAIGTNIVPTNWTVEQSTEIILDRNARYLLYEYIIV